MVFLALGGIFIDAYDFTSLGIGVDTLREQLSLSPFELGSVTAVMAFGALVGAFGGGYVTDRLGRFKTFIIDLICLVVAAIGSALAWDLWSLLFFRFLLGVGVGMDFPVALSFIAEFTNSQTKGKYVNLWQAMWYIAAASTGLFVLPLYLIGVGDNLWRWAVGLGARTTLTSIIASTQSMEYFAVGFYLPSITALLFGGTPQEGALYGILGAIVFNIF